VILRERRLAQHFASKYEAFSFPTVSNPKPMFLIHWLIAPEQLYHLVFIDLTGRFALLCSDRKGTAIANLDCDEV